MNPGKCLLRRAYSAHLAGEDLGFAGRSSCGHRAVRLQASSQLARGHEVITG